MSDCRTLRKYLSLCLVLVVVSMICRPCLAQEADALPLDDPKAVLEKVISALKNLELPARGRGTAVMLTENYREWLDNTELIVDFVFTEQLSRTDIFEASGGIAGSRLFAQAVSDESEVSVHRDGVAAGRRRRHLDIGLDFKPEVFMHFKGTALTKRLQDFLLFFDRPGVDTSVKLDDKGILHLVAGGHVVDTARGKEYDNEVQYRFDTRKGLLPVYYSDEFRYADPNRWIRSEVRLDWTEYNSTWYPSRVERVLQPGNRDHRTIVIESFTPDVKEEQFMMDWLDIPDGLSVIGARKERWYKSPLRSVEDPEIPLDEIDFVRELRERQSSVASKVDAGEAASGLYLRDYQTGRLIGPLSLEPGSLLPPLDKETYIVANPTESELAIRKHLLETNLHESAYFDCTIAHVIGDINRTLESRLGDKAPPVLLERLDESKLPVVTLEMSGKEVAHDVLFDIAARARARIFIENGEVVLSRKKLREIASLEITTSGLVATTSELPSR